MHGLSRQQKQLSKALLDLGSNVMPIEELDGFFAGIVVCPEIIVPSIWQPWVWSSADGEGEPVFESRDHADTVKGLVMVHYSHVANTLLHEPERYGPIVGVDKGRGEILWELWIEGFEKAVKLRPEAWEPLASADIETSTAWAELMMLADVVRRDSRFSDEQIKAISATAHDRIAGWVIQLKDWRLANPAPTPTMLIISTAFADPHQNIRSSDPCPCNSGKQFMKCCGLN